ncbi:MAG: SBBP repeat-containing protein [Chlorobi bacterium]|nr:SBBP repeat-containing protein [Chlorobiota bacterium]MCI0717002.1 SBBP repeat-containing protein [Chlorobiota bacterium]
MKYTIFLLSILILHINSQVQQQWVSFYAWPGSTTGEANSIAVDNSGNVYVTGKSDGISTDYDIATVKYNSSGVQQWASRFNGPQGDGWDEGFAIALDNSGNVYVCGTTSLSDTNYEFCTLKYNSNRAQQWVRTYSGSAGSDDFAFSLAVDNSGNVYVTGYITQTSGYNMCTIKYNADGAILWVSTYAGPQNSGAVAYSLKMDPLGNVYVAGDCQTVSSGSDYCTIKYNNSGVVQWIRFYNSPGNDNMRALTLDNNGNAIVTGKSFVTVYTDYATVKYNPQGDTQWVRIYNGPESGADDPSSIAADAEGNIFVTGVSFDINFNSAMCTIKYDSNGVQQWVNRFNGSGNAFAFSVATGPSGNSYITGGNVSGCTIKYSSGGSQQWLIQSDSLSGGKSIAVDQQNNVYVTGAGGDGYCTIKYSQPIGIQTISSEIPKRFSLYQNYPNPFNPVTKIKFDLPVSSESFLLVVYDILGREITLINESLQAGVYEVNFDAFDLPSGVYFYQITAGKYVETKKMVLIK